MTPGEFRLRIEYGKRGRLRYLSHLEVVHAMERTVRRAGLEVAVTRGFNPHMKVAFGPALPVGTEGLSEFLDVWLTRYTGADEVLARLDRVSPRDLAPIAASYVSASAPSLTAALTIGTYRIEVDGEETTADRAQAALSQVMAEGRLELEHKGKTKVYDLARSVPEEPRVKDREGGVEVRLSIRMGPEGSLRPESLVRSAFAASRVNVTAVRTTRLQTLIEDDGGVWSRPA